MTKKTRASRNRGAGQFILGVHGFTPINAVEGIVASKRLTEDLRRLKTHRLKIVVRFSPKYMAPKNNPTLQSFATSSS